MSTLRVIVVNTDHETAPELRAHLLSIDGLKIVAEVEEPMVLTSALAQFPADALLIHLDPNPQAMMDVIAPILTSREHTPATIAMTEDRDPELVMRAMRAGMREFLWKPFPPEQLNDILQRIRGSLGETTRRSGKLIPIVGTAGGVGVTTLATNLAVELAQLEEWKDSAGIVRKPNVAVVDLDFRYGQVALFLDADPEFTIADLCDSPEQLDRQMIEKAVVKHPSGVHVLAHPTNIDQAEQVSAAHVAGALAALQDHYDFVVVDGPVRFDPTARAVYDMTDFYLVALQLLVPAVRNTDRLLHTLSMSGYAIDRVRLVCNRYGRESGYLEPSDVEATLGRKINWIIQSDWKTASAAVNMGAPLATYAPKSKLRLQLRDMAADLAGLNEIETDEDDVKSDAKRGGFLSMFGSQRR